MPELVGSWHTEREWFVYRGGTYCGEIVYHPHSMRWSAHPWRAFGRLALVFFDELDEAIRWAAGQ